MKVRLTLLVCCLTAVLTSFLVSCGDDDDFGRGYPYNPGNPEQPSQPVKNSIEGQWKGNLKVKCYVFGRVFTSAEEYIRIIPNKSNSTIGTGEMICFYDDKQCPLEAESMYFTWYVKDGSIYVDVPCDKGLNCTVANWSVADNTLTGVMKGETFSDVLSLEPLNGYDEWNLYSEDTHYAVFYRQQSIKESQWTGDLSFSYTEGEETYQAVANIRFKPTDKQGLRGVGEEIERYERPCPIRYESLYFTWKMVDGVLQLTYPYNEELNVDFYQILQSDDSFEALFNVDGECHLVPLVGYTDWHLYEDETSYGRAYYDDLTVSPSLLRAARAAGCKGRRTVENAAARKNVSTRRVGRH